MDGPVRTNAGLTAKVTVACRPLFYGKSIGPRGDLELCTVRNYRKSGVVTVTTYGRPVSVGVKLKAPEVPGYTAYVKKKTYASG